MTWTTESLDGEITAMAEAMIHEANEIAKSRGLYHPFIYQNYAYVTQDVFTGYGTNSKQRLLKIQNEYDPDLVFTELQPGYHKLRK